MPEFFVGTKQGEMGLEDWQNLLARFPDHAPRAVRSALQAEGYRLQQIIKTSIQLGGPKGVRWPPLHPHTLAIMAARRRQARWAAKRAKGGKVRGPTVAKYRGHAEINPGAFMPLRKLAGAARYYYDEGTKTVTIGFLDPQKRGLAKKHAEGFTQTVDRRMGRYLAAHGFPVKTGTVLKVPPRPVVEPVFRAEERNIYHNLRERVVNNIYRYLTGKAKDWDKASDTLTI
ncbi:MAG TPA: hypothetical protein VLH60_05090 [Sedimentisphaerales bacterium]|nr:hypothetical protein [Sedimentisphaerales bacterium]